MLEQLSHEPAELFQFQTSRQSVRHLAAFKINSVSEPHSVSSVVTLTMLHVVFSVYFCYVACKLLVCVQHQCRCSTIQKTVQTGNYIQNTKLKTIYIKMEIKQKLLPLTLTKLK